MFEYNSEDLKYMAQEHENAIIYKFGSKFAISAVIAEMITYDHDIENILNHFYTNKVAPAITELLKLYDALVECNHSIAKPYEIGGGDRYAAYVPCAEGKVLAFCNQNVSYVVVFTPQKTWVESKNGEYETVDSYIVHIRMVTSSRNSIEPYYAKFNTNYETMLKGAHTERYDNNASDYFRYHDGRDRGYVMTLTPSTFNKYSKVFYTTENMYGMPAARYIIDELCYYASVMDETLEEMTNG